MDTYKELNDMLVELFNEIMDIEERALIINEFNDITNKDMHVIEAIGDVKLKNMTTIAKKLSVTTGTLTISINNLEKKGYVIRERCSDDRRVIYARLTEKGVNAYNHHAQFHRKMVKQAVDSLKPEEKEVLAQLLSKLKKFFYEYKN